MKNKFLFVLAMLIWSMNALAYDMVVRRFSVEGNQAKALYEALIGESSADITNIDSNTSEVTLSEGFDCQLKNSSCKTWTYDGDDKPLRQSEALSKAISATSATQKDSQISIDGITCDKSYNDLSKQTSYFCRLEQLVK